MTTNMQKTLQIQSSKDPLIRVLDALCELIKNVKASHQSFVDDLTVCRELRRDRKEFQKQMKLVVAAFKTMPERKQVELEAELYKLISQISQMAPEAIQELKEANRLIFSWFLIREIKRTLRCFLKGQKEMESFLYKHDPIEEIYKNPELAKAVQDAWGDLAYED